MAAMRVAPSVIPFKRGNENDSADAELLQAIAADKHNLCVLCCET
jgi:hypothetical protein